MKIETNIFLEYQIIQNSDIKKLSEELDVIIASGRVIYLWSKKVNPIEMKNYCKNKIVPITEEEKKLHTDVFNMKLSGKTYKEISEKTGATFDKIPFYINVMPGKEWVLDDWIGDYFKKDSTIYPKVDMLIDNDQRMVDRFKRNGIPARFMEKI